MAGVIKSGQLQEGAASVQVAAFNFEDLSRKADTYLETVRRQAAQILTQARQQSAAIEKQAQENGRQAALREAEQTVQAQLDQRLGTLIPALDQAIESLRQAREGWLKHWERNTIQLAVAIAERLVRRELSRAPEISLEWLREALELVTAEGCVTVRLHPRDCELLGQRASALVERMSRLGTCSIVADGSIEAGGCRVETEFGLIDQQISVQLARIGEELSGD